MSYHKKKIEVELLEEAKSYFDNQNIKIQKKILVLFDKTSIRLKGEWFKPLGDGIWEFRARDHQKFYRILAFWDKTGKEKTLIMATHGFDKKTNKTPKNQIGRANRIREQYFLEKENK